MSDPLPPGDLAKRAAATRALDWIEDGMAVGLGTGSTAAWFVDLLAEHLAQTNKSVVGVATSTQTYDQAKALGIPLTSLGEAGRLDVTIDGTDEFDANLNLIKGGGGALLQEKIVAGASENMIVIADASKEVKALGAFDLPVEVVRFGWEATVEQVLAVLESADVGSRTLRLREADGAPYVTDEGHFILDLALGRIGTPEELSIALNRVPGVVENGLFCGMASVVIVGEPDETTRLVTAA